MQWVASKLYRVGVNLATRLDLYGKRETNYVNQIVLYLKKFKPDLNSHLMILDVGAGKGQISNLVANTLREALVVAIDKYTVPKGSRNVVSVIADAHCLPFKDSSFDVVLMFSILEHLTQPEVAVNEVSRVLKVGGLAIVQLPNLQWFIEPHTKWPLLFLMPPFLRERVKRSTGYSELNLDITYNNVIKMFIRAGLRPLSSRKWYHGVKILSILHWPPAWFLIFIKT